MTSVPDNTLVVVHYHWRPGGVRRVVETALPALARTGRFGRIMLAAGEAPEVPWLDALRDTIGSCPLEVVVIPEFAYGGRNAEETGEAALRLLRASGPASVVWAHNLALGRNAFMSASLARAAAETGAVFLSHHHDFLFDQRWHHWATLRAQGFGGVPALAEALFASAPRTVHLCLNHGDRKLLARGFGSRAVAVPNPVVMTPVDETERAAARAWLDVRCGSSTPRWIMPCRLMRRKNIAEAVLLARWLAPGARVVTTAGPSSDDERLYAQSLTAAAQRGRWPLELAVRENCPEPPSVPALMAAAEAVVTTSLHEGFGLAAYEASALGRPIIARQTAEIEVARLEGATIYRDVQIPCDLFDQVAERRRQASQWDAWRSALPAEAAAHAVPPLFVEGSQEVVAFSRLTLVAQVEVIDRGSAVLADTLDFLNPQLAALRGRDLFPSKMPVEVSRHFTAESFAARICSAIDRSMERDPIDAHAAQRVLEGFLEERLTAANFYPLLCTSDS